MWNEELLLPLAEINELLLGVLRTRALSPRPAVPPLVAALRDLWRDLDDAALARLARCPYLLLDAGFGSPACWTEAVRASISDREESAPAAASAGGYFDDREGMCMVGHALVFARYLARSHRADARMIIALHPQCADLLANRSLRELEQLAATAPAWIQPRWAAQPLIWRQMLEAAISAPPEGLQRVRERGLQLLAALW